MEAAAFAVSSLCEEDCAGNAQNHAPRLPKPCRPDLMLSFALARLKCFASVILWCSPSSPAARARISRSATVTELLVRTSCRKATTIAARPPRRSGPVCDKLLLTRRHALPAANEFAHCRLSVPHCTANLD